jgi:CRP-like cAMP-binding protein
VSDRLITVERVALLHGVEFFQGAPTHVLASIARHAVEVDKAAGTVLIEQGDSGDCLYVVASGRVRIDQDGRTIREVDAGDVVGDLALLSPGPRTASAVVTESALLLRVGADALDELLLDHPEVARGIIEVLVRRLRPIAPT